MVGDWQSMQDVFFLFFFFEFADEQVHGEGYWSAFLESWTLQLCNDAKMSPQLKRFFFFHCHIYSLCLNQGCLLMIHVRMLLQKSKILTVFIFFTGTECAQMQGLQLEGTFSSGRFAQWFSRLVLHELPWWSVTVQEQRTAKLPRDGSNRWTTGQS
jgi:hypothetical protein